MAADRGPFRAEIKAPPALRPGHLLWMPAGSTWLNRDKPRPFVLVTPCSEYELGTLVYGSTQATEKSAGANFVEVSPVRGGLHGNGLRAKTYFYPSTLLPIPHEDLPPHSGFLGGALSELRQALRLALGIGTGSCLSYGAPAASCRGRIVVLGATLAQEIGTAVAVVLTEPRYSAVRNYQIIVPVFTGHAGSAGRHDLLVSGRAWLEVFPGRESNVLLAIPATHSVWHADEIARETEYVVDDDTLAEIDQRLCDYFSLPPADAAGDQR